MRMKTFIKRLAAEFVQLAYQDGKLPLRDREWRLVDVSGRSGRELKTAINLRNLKKFRES